MTGDVESMVDQAGKLPDAPLAMPKQRLEVPATGLAGLIARLAGRAAVSGEARRSGQ